MMRLPATISSSIRGGWDQSGRMFAELGPTRENLLVLAEDRAPRP